MSEQQSDPAQTKQLTVPEALERVETLLAQSRQYEAARVVQAGIEMIGSLSARLKVAEAMAPKKAGDQPKEAENA